MQSRTLGRFGLILSALLVLVFALLPFASLHAQNYERVITIYFDGKEQTVVTDAPTVRDVLNRAKVSFSNNDLVEPGLDTLLSAPSYDINIYRARPVTVVDGSQRITVITPQTSADKIAESAGIALYPEDTTELSRIDNFLAEDGVGLKLTVIRAKPVNAVLYGASQQIRTQAKTVGDLMKEKNIVLGGQDGTNVPLDTPITADMNLKVWRNGVQTVTEEHPIDFTSRQIFDSDQPIGYKAVQTAGVQGKRTITYELEMQNGIEVARKEIQSVVISQPRQQVEVIGSKPPANIDSYKSELMAQVGIPQGDWTYVDYIITRESGWCATKWQGQWGSCPAYHGVPSSGGYGLCQSTPPQKMASAGDDWQYNPVTQLKWCNSYALSKFKSWQAAYNYWLANHNW